MTDSPPSSTLTTDSERNACIRIDPPGFHIRHPPPPHDLTTYITPDSQLFQTIHMGPALVDIDRWRLVISGLVERPYSISFEELKAMPKASITSFHECYGPPTAPPTKAYWRVGNVKWTGVRLRSVLERARPLPEAEYVWSDGLDSGKFAGRYADRYQKDLPLAKAMGEEVMIAYAMNDVPLSMLRGGPVRLVVPGWFGTNSTKWLCRLRLEKGRSPSLYTTVWYNERDPGDESGERMRPVWSVEPNSMIVRPKPGEVIGGKNVVVEGRAWSCDGIVKVEINVDGKDVWEEASLETRLEYQWQVFACSLKLKTGDHKVMARATCKSGQRQPLEGRRNHVHTVSFHVDAG